MPDSRRLSFIAEAICVSRLEDLDVDSEFDESMIKITDEVLTVAC
jgi:hypothetical protein